MKSLLLLLTIIVSCVLIHTGLRLYGYTFTYAERRSPILENHNTEIWEPGLNHQEYLKSLKLIDEKCSESCLISLNTYYTRDEKYVIFSDPDNSFRHISGNKSLSLPELQSKLATEVLLLEDFLKNYPNAKGFIQIQANTPGVVRNLLPLMQENLYFKRFVLCSQFGNVVRKIRDDKPHWNTCASQDEKTKAHMLSSIYLESITPLPTEYFYFSKSDKEKYSERLKDEILRRTLFVIEAR